MSEQTVPTPNQEIAQVFGGLRDARVGVAIGLTLWVVFFHEEIAAAIRTWIASTAYNHCFLVIPIAAFLIWERRDTLRGLLASPLPLVALAAVPLAAVWLIAERLGIMEGRQLVAIGFIEVLFLATLGWRLWLAVLGPLLYLVFLVPFGEFLTPKLQDITTVFVRHGVDILRIPAYIDGYIIDIPEGTFFIAEACAGLRFLIASIAFGGLYGLMMYRGFWRRTAFIAASIVVPIVANGFRALGIVWLGHVMGSAEAAAADHVLYGWIFFSIVILLLIAVGLPFRQDQPMAPVAIAPMTPETGAARRGLIAGLAVAAAAAIGPLATIGLTQAAAAPRLAPKPLDLGSTCRAIGPAVPDQGGGPGRAVTQRVECGEDKLDILVEVFAPRTTAAPIAAERRRLTRAPDVEDVTETALATEPHDPIRVWRLVRSNQPAHATAIGVWIDGEPARLGFAMRTTLARTSLTGTDFAPVIVAITPAVDWPHLDMREGRALDMRLTVFLQSHPEIDAQVREIAAAAAR